MSGQATGTTRIFDLFALGHFRLTSASAHYLSTPDKFTPSGGVGLGTPKAVL